MSKRRVVKSHEDITMTEVTQSDGKTIIDRAYSVRDRSDPTSTQSFGDMGAADTYFDELVLRRQKPE